MKICCVIVVIDRSIKLKICGLVIYYKVGVLLWSEPDLTHTQSVVDHCVQCGRHCCRFSTKTVNTRWPCSNNRSLQTSWMKVGQCPVSCAHRQRHMWWESTVWSYVELYIIIVMSNVCFDCTCL